MDGQGTTQPTTQPEDGNVEPRWTPLNRVQRRILGVLIEKAKTTPDSYPLSLNGLTTGSNQKSNRSPKMDLSADDIELETDNLRKMGAVAEIHTGGRVSKYRHYGKEWMGVDKYELAVMAELLLRGEQTLGELRGRASRMESIADLSTLKPILESLLAKGLMVELTPAGRGQVVTHNLYQPEELERIQGRYGDLPPSASRPESSRPEGGRPAPPVGQPSLEAAAAASQPSAPAASQPSAETVAEISALRTEVEQLQEDVQELRTALETLEDKFEQLMS